MRLQKLLGPSSILSILAAEILLVLACYSAAIYLLIDVDPTVLMLHNGGLSRVLAVTAVIVAGLYVQDLYEDVRVRSRILLIQQVCLALGLAFLLQAMLNYADSTLVFPRWTMLIGSGLVLVALPTFRIIFSSVVTSTLHAERVLFVGFSPLVARICDKIRERPELGMAGIGFVGQPPEGEADRNGMSLLGPTSAFREIVDQRRPERIVVAQQEQRGAALQSELLEMRFSGIAIEEVGATYETVFDRVCVEKLRPSQLIFSSDLGPREVTRFLQTIYTFAIALVGLILSLPLMLVAALLIKLTSKGPVLYRQERVGLRGKPFVLYKFRSMYTDAETRTGAVWARKNDPRVTPVGRFFRRFRIDEIPQLYNVLKGEMSIVGPRPERPEFVETLVQKIPFYRQRLVVKPGITGWAQINHKYSDTIEDTITKLEYDLFYIKNLSPAMDAYIMFHTAKVILLGRGAQ